MAYIELTQGKKAIVDNDCLELLNAYKWHFAGGSGGYAYTTIGGRKNKKSIAMHRLLSNPKMGYEVDHINGNRLDNRRSNLRNCTRLQNIGNSTGYSSKSSHKGVEPLRDKFRARIGMNGRTVHLGMFDTEKEAAQAYNQAASSHYGKFAKLNEVAA